MFGFGKKTAPPLCKSNPGICVEGKVALTRGDRSWTEQFNTVTLAASALQERGLVVRLGRGRYDFVEPMFGEYVRRVAGNEPGIVPKR